VEDIDMTDIGDAERLLSAYMHAAEGAQKRIEHLDPYLLWQIATNFRGMRGRGGELPRVLTFIVETKLGVQSSFQTAAYADLGKAAPGRAQVNHARPAWLSNMWFYDRGRFGNFRVATGAEEGNQTWFERVMALAVDENTVRMQLGYSRLPRLGNGIHDLRPKPPSSGAEGDGAGATAGAEAEGSPWFKGVQVVLGVLEDSCPFAHSALRHEGGGTRVVAYWNQSDFEASKPPPGAWTDPPETTGATDKSYGLELTHSAMNQALADHTYSGTIDEEAVYTSLDIRVLARMRESHAGLVIPLMAGSGDQTCAQPSNQASEEIDLKRWKPDEPASLAPVIAVNLPRELVRVSSGRWMGVQILDGLHYIASKAKSLCGEQARVVVNVSYGAIAGPHDGSGIIEEAMKELTDALYKDKLAIVLAAGNAHGTTRHFDKDLVRVPSGVHSSIKNLANGMVSFTLWVPPEKQRETFLELWLSNQERSLQSPMDVEIQVECEDNPEFRLSVRMDEMKFWPEAGAEPALGLFALRRPSQSTRRSMALLVLPGTELSDRYPSVPSGRWKITVLGSQPHSDISVEAWVERDEVLVGLRRPQSARLICDSPDDPAAGLSDFNTLNNIATGEGVLVVGALNASRGLIPPPSEIPEVSAYSSATREDGKLSFSAVADSGFARQGIRTGGNRSGMVVRANGTSLAAPQVTRWIANQLASGATLAQIHACVAEDKTRTPRRGKVVP
jgi:hypothetical protein